MSRQATAADVDCIRVFPVTPTVFEDIDGWLYDEDAVAYTREACSDDKGDQMILVMAVRKRHRSPMRR